MKTKDRFARTGMTLRAPSIDPNAIYLRREVKHLLRDLGDDALSELVASGQVRKFEIGNNGQWRIRGQWLLDFVEERGKVAANAPES